MNKLLIIFYISLSIGHFATGKQHLDTPQYIMIKHDGIEQKFIRPLFIYTKAITIKVIGGNALINSQKVQKLTEKDKMILSNGDYSTLILDEKTFQKLSNFIKQYSHFIKKSEDKSSVNYSIIFNNEIYEISYKQTHIFFSDLTKSLKTDNYDKNNVDGLVSYLNSNFH